MRTSIKGKIIIFHLIVLFAALSVLGGLLYFSLNRIVYDGVDSELLSKARALGALASGEREDREELLSSAEFVWEYGSTKSKSFYQIRRFDGSTVEKSPSLRNWDLPYAGKPDGTIFKTIRVNGITTRLVEFPASVEGEAAVTGTGKGLVIQCAEDIRNQMDILQHYGLVLLASLVAVMAASAFGGVMISRKALAPVKDISETIDTISESNLSERINVGYVPKELKILASSFNRTVDRLEEAFRRQNQFAADASHELRTPLSVILSQSEIALRKERTATEYKSALAEVMKTAHNMTSTVRKLLTMTRLRSDKGQFDYEKIDLGAIIDESVRLLRPLAERKRVRLQVLATSGRLSVSGDRAALLELFINLLDNAVKYSVPGGKVQVSLGREKTSVRCEIRDTGIGIPESDLEHVFDRFYRAEQSRSKEIEGSGLGLSICREIVELHGGRIGITSRKGEGTSVSVYLNDEDA